jgi:arylformamidase
MDVIDLSHIISESMPVYPGMRPPQIIDACTIAKQGFAEKLLGFYSHTGTHVDAPGHILAGAATLDRFAAGDFIGPGCVLDVSRVKNGQIEIADLRGQEHELKKAAFALLHSGWARHWGNAGYFSHYPVLSPAAARWLAGFALKGVGVDMISVDEMNSTALVVHKVLLAKNFLIIENLAHLETLIGKKFTFTCLPLKLKDSDGSPVRAVALLT